MRAKHKYLSGPSNRLPYALLLPISIYFYDYSACKSTCGIATSMRYSVFAKHVKDTGHHKSAAVECWDWKSVALDWRQSCLQWHFCRRRGTWLISKQERFLASWLNRMYVGESCRSWIKHDLRPLRQCPGAIHIELQQTATALSCHATKCT